jgi:hypothetical protein
VEVVGALVDVVLPDTLLAVLGPVLQCLVPHLTHTAIWEGGYIYSGPNLGMAPQIHSTIQVKERV